MKPCGPPYPACDGGGRAGKPDGGAASGARGGGGGLWCCCGGGTLLYVPLGIPGPPFTVIGEGIPAGGTPIGGIPPNMPAGNG
jgi:hypothetical protein